MGGRELVSVAACAMFLMACTLLSICTASTAAGVSDLSVTRLLADWTIIGKSRTVKELGASLAMSGNAVGLTQVNGAYLSADDDKRLFSSGSDKSFVDGTTASNTGARIALETPST